MKLIDFGYLLELDLVNVDTFGPADVTGAEYVAPEVREMKSGRLALADLLAMGGSLGDVLKANDIWMLGQLLFYLLCKPSEVMSGKFFAEHYEWRGPDGWEVSSGMTVDRAKERQQRLGVLGLPARLDDLLFGKMLVPLQRRSKDVQELASAAALLGADIFRRGQAGLLQYAWPYFVPETSMAKRPGRDEGDDALRRGALFEPDVKFVKVRCRRRGADWTDGEGNRATQAD